MMLFFIVTGPVSAEEIYIPSTSLGGVKYTAASPGVYRVSFIDGAARGPDKTPAGDCGFCRPGYPCWVNAVYVYKNRDVYWGPSERPSVCQPVPAAPDYQFGTGTYYSSQEAERAVQGQFFDVSLNTGDWLIFTIVDFKNSYETNTGGMTIRISPVQQQGSPVSTFTGGTSQTLSPTSPPVTMSSAGQELKTSNGDPGIYLAIIVFLVLILCIVGAYSLFLRRKKHPADARYTDTTLLPGHTPQGTDAGRVEKNRPLLSTDEPVHHDVFISYNQVDKPVADAVCAKLEARKIRCWIAPRDVRPGMGYPEEIINGITGSRIMVLVFSSHSNDSPHVLREISTAVNKGLIIIPFRIENVKPSKSMEYLIGVPHWLDAITPPLEQHLDVLSETIENFLRDLPK